MFHRRPLAPPVLILSTGRCGSTTLSNILNLHPRILSLSEFFSFTGIAPLAWRNPHPNRVWRAISHQPRRMRRMLAHDYDEVLYPFHSPLAQYTRKNIPPVMCATLPHLSDEPNTLFDFLRDTMLSQPRQPTANLYRDVFDTLAVHLNRSVWIERSGASLLFASTLLKAFPEARVIHLYRDGRETALSMSRHYLFQMIASRLRTFGLLGFDPHRMIATDPRWDRKAVLLYAASALLPHRRIDPDRPPPLEDFGRLWNAMMERSHMLLRGIPYHRKHAISFDDLCNDPRAVLTDLIEFIDPSLADDAWLSKAAKLPLQYPSAFSALEPERQAALADACEPSLHIFDYVQPATPSTPDSASP